MPRHRFEYAIIQLVPRVERGERLNAGVVLHCRTLDFLGAKIALDRARLLALAPGVDVDAVEAALAAIPKICAGDPAGGPIARLPAPERFHWLVSPRSTIVQTSPVHSGMCDDPPAVLDRLLATMVL